MIEDPELVCSVIICGLVSHLSFFFMLFYEIVLTTEVVGLQMQ
jgi:hypothetical protein